MWASLDHMDIPYGALLWNIAGRSPFSESTLGKPQQSHHSISLFGTTGCTLRFRGRTENFSSVQSQQRVVPIWARFRRMWVLKLCSIIITEWIVRQELCLTASTSSNVLSRCKPADKNGNIFHIYHRKTESSDCFTATASYATLGEDADSRWWGHISKYYGLSQERNSEGHVICSGMWSDDR